MLKVHVIAFGTLSEPFYRDAAAEYVRRLGGDLTVTELKETRLPKEPSEAEIKKALEDEGERMLAAVPPRSFLVAMCVEGRELTSPELAAAIGKAADSGARQVCFLIGSSYGLAPKVKEAAALRLSLSKLTLPHQLARVVLCEAVYRSGEILRGSKYHK